MKKSISETIHDSVKSLHKIGIVDTITMHEFNALCLKPVKVLKPKEIRKIRKREKE